VVDGYVFLTPLFALAIILLFAFVGCPLDRSGIVGPGIPIAMYYPPGLDADVQKFEIWFGCFVPSQIVEGAEIGTVETTFETTPTTVHHPSINPEGGTISQWVDQIDLNMEALVRCHCIVTTSATPSDETSPETPHELQSDQKQKEVDENVWFSLLRPNGTFQLE
jgi:hypothetical protein